jgi:hypothetical protein
MASSDAVAWVYATGKGSGWSASALGIWKVSKKWVRMVIDRPPAWKIRRSKTAEKSSLFLKLVNQ